MSVLTFWLPAALACAVNVSAVVPAAAASQTDRVWNTYRDATLGFSFEFPADLSLERKDVEAFNIEGLVGVIDVVAKSRSLIVLRVFTFEGSNPMTPRYDRATLRKVCKNFKDIKLRDGAGAINCVTCGRGACSWSVYVLGERWFELISFGSYSGSTPEPRDGRFPLLTMVRSFRPTENDHRDRH